MKNTQKIFLAFIVFILSGCDLVKDILPTPINNGDCILRKTFWSIPNDPASETTNYIYNSVGNLVEVRKDATDLGSDVYTEKWLLTYANNKVNNIKHYYGYNGGQDLSSTYEFFYNDLGPHTIMETTVDGMETLTNCEYNNSKLSKLISNRYYPADSTYGVIKVTELQWTGDNVTSTVENITLNGNRTYNYTYEYDNMKGPMNHFGFAFASSNLSSLSKNNVLKSNSTINGVAYINQQTYEYNTSDFPTKMIPGDSQSYPLLLEYVCK